MKQYLENTEADDSLVDPFGARPPVADKKLSLAEHAYTALRKAIRQGSFEPGERLRETEIADWLQISRTPVREAFRRMISEGLLVIGSWNGVAVVDLDRQQVIELYAVRRSLEATAARLAAQQASDLEIRLMRDILEREQDELADTNALPQINLELHETIYCAAHNRYLLQSLNSVIDTLGVLRSSTFVLPGSAVAAHREHEAIVEAIARRDPDKAETLAGNHVDESLRLRLRLMSQRN